MDFEEYKLTIDEFFDFIDQDRPPNKAINSWFGYFERLSLQTFAAVLDVMKAELDRRPYNMLNKIREYVSIYYREHPEARPKLPDEECTDCFGQGYFIAKYTGPDGRPATGLILCGSCENWQKVHGTTRGKLRLKRFEAEYKGFKIENG